MYHSGDDGYRRARDRMVDDLCRRGILYSGSLTAVMREAPRHLFVSEALRYRAYEDASLPVGHNQTVSRPSTIARMIQCLGLCGDERVLEIGTGTGYQSALLSGLASQVVTAERIRELYRAARDNLLFRLRCRNVRLHHNEDFSMEGPFDAIVVAAGACVLPERLLSLLSSGGKLVIPIAGAEGQSLKRYVKRGDGSVAEDDMGAASFVPLVYNA